MNGATPSGPNASIATIARPTITPCANGGSIAKPCSTRSRLSEGRKWLAKPTSVRVSRKGVKKVAGASQVVNPAR